jgi:hypothetical protein
VFVRFDLRFGRGLQGRRASLLRAFAAACFVSVLFCSAAVAAAADTTDPSNSNPEAAMLVVGFHQLYELNFQGARLQFLAYQSLQPQDPVGKAAEAASYLYEEFNAKGVFTSAFFLNNDRLLGGVNGTAAENRNDAFLKVNHDTREMARQQLKSDPGNARAMLALTLADGMESDYDALIIKKQMAGLGLMRQAESEANKLLEIDPTAQDAYVALGASNYVIGCLPNYKRAFLWFGGIHGDRQRGMEQMQVAAEHGRYLAPFAKILLALACEREHEMAHARQLLTDLAAEFPANPLFARELGLLQRGVTGGE